MPTKLTLLSVVLLACGTLYANSYPGEAIRKARLRELPLPGHSVGPQKQEDLKDLQIQMVSEQVDLTLVREAARSYLDVDVTFMMKNHSDADVTMGVCYPIGAKNDMVSFHAETEGDVHEVVLREEKPPAAKGGFRTEQFSVWFYDWTATFPAGQSCIHKVKYRVDMHNAFRTGYTVSTGGPWKGKIEKSIITLQGSPAAWAFVRAFGPTGQGGAEQSGDRLVWRYRDYDPAPEHDIWIDYKPTTLRSELDQHRQNKHLWGELQAYCTKLHSVHYSTGALTHSPEQWREYRSALHDLVRAASIDGEKVTMPRTEVQRVNDAGPN